MRKSEVKLNLDTLIRKMDKFHNLSNSIEDAINTLHVLLNYTLLDLEATRREKEIFRKML